MNVLVVMVKVSFAKTPPPVPDPSRSYPSEPEPAAAELPLKRLPVMLTEPLTPKMPPPSLEPSPELLPPWARLLLTELWLKVRAVAE